MAQEFPMFESGQIYWIKGETLNQIRNWCLENKIVIVPGSGLKVDEVGPNGTQISIDGTDVCP
jgi:hypothetical protein